MILGYELSGPDNNSYMYNETEHISTCPECGFITDFITVNSKLTINKRIYDLSYTYDNRLIVSLKFKEFLIRKNVKGLIFDILPSDPDFYYLIVNNTLEFDTVKRKTKFESYCKSCKMYRQVAGATPVFLKNIESPLCYGVYSTDVLFGSGNELSPLIIISPLTYDDFKKEKFKGINYKAIEI